MAFFVRSPVGFFKEIQMRMTKTIRTGDSEIVLEICDETVTTSDAARITMLGEALEAMEKGFAPLAIQPSGPPVTRPPASERYDANEVS